MACLLGFGLKEIFHWKAHLLIFARLELSWEFELLLSFALKKIKQKYKDISPAKILNIEVNPSGKSLIYIKNRSGPRTELCRTPA